MKIVFLEPLGVKEQTLRNLKQDILGDGFTVEYYSDRKEDKQSLIARSSDADVVVLSNIPYTREIMESNPNLKMLCVAFTGVDHIDREYCHENDILVSNASGYATIAVAELVFGLLFSLYRNIPSCDTATRTGKTKDGLVGFELAGKTFGIVGLGAIGTAVAKRALAFGCKVLATNSNPTAMEGVTMVSLDTLLEKSDVVSLHVPLTPETCGLIGNRELALMKKQAVLINTARGPVVDSEALAQALENGAIAGAGLDVFDTEPPISPEEPLLKAPHTILTPHVAFATAESMEKRAIIAFENITAWRNGMPQNVMK